MEVVAKRGMGAGVGFNAGYVTVTAFESWKGEFGGWKLG